MLSCSTITSILFVVVVALLCTMDMQNAFKTWMCTASNNEVTEYNIDISSRIQELEYKVNKLEKQRRETDDYINDLESEIQELKSNDRFTSGRDEQIHRVSLLPQWGGWSSWSDCYMNCTGANGGRVQSRSRETITNPLEKSPQKETETETRPCNSVQFAGCIQDFGVNDNYGVTYDFADQIAVSTCTALLPGGTSHVYAVRRTCSNLAVSCGETCKHVGLKCFNALHVYRGSPVLNRNQDGTKGLYVYRYNGCDGNFCGPNFCCCRT